MNMMKTLLCATAALVAFAPAANAASYILNYSGNAAPGSAMLTVHVADTVNAVGGYDILHVSGNVGAESVLGLIANPNQPYQATSPSGLFTYDNVLYLSGASVSNAGLMFKTALREWNLFSDSPTQYQLYSATNSGYDIHSTGTLSVSAVPEARTWALLIAGFGLIGAGLRRQRGLSSMA